MGGIEELYKTEDGKRLLKKIQDRITDVMYEFQDWKGIKKKNPIIEFYYGQIRRRGMYFKTDVIRQMHLHSIHKKIMKFQEIAEEASLNTFYSNVPEGISDPMRQYLDSNAEALQNTQIKKRKLGE